MSLEEGRKGTYLVGSCGGCGEDAVKVTPTTHRAHGWGGYLSGQLPLSTRDSDFWEPATPP